MAVQDFTKARERMVKEQLMPRGICDPGVLAAMGKVPRHLFVEEALWGDAYSDYPLPIGERQTISQPYIVALMTQALELTGKEKILEIGTGSGYQTAVLAELSAKVFSIERIPALVSRARKLLDQLHYHNVQLKVFDGTLGWPEEAPFDGIIVTAAAPKIPAPYIQQLAPQGRLVIPVGDRYSQTLLRITKGPEGLVEEDLCGARFVSLIGEHGWED
ncbi:MAG: protein-L-isoaspartate(D-aspartate) O-methyltransferase [Deltaproteobacteria bacterium]|nr:protein-L-isoaspartate(D-aspartate) O-methyltransferase [Deltaproteobacteria bacterium]